MTKRNAPLLTRRNRLTRTESGAHHGGTEARRRGITAERTSATLNGSICGEGASIWLKLRFNGMPVTSIWAAKSDLDKERGELQTEPW